MQPEYRSLEKIFGSEVRLTVPLFQRPYERGGKGKHSALDMHSGLRLNANLVKKCTMGWDEKMIGQRSLELFEAASRIWPDPSSLMSSPWAS
jgi:hypothetical protein